MLNELYEYDQYVNKEDLKPKDFYAKYGTRLGYRRIVTQDLIGLKRPMVIIARHILSPSSGEEDEDKVQEDDRLRRLESAVECLISWCGIKSIKREGDNNYKRSSNESNVKPDEVNIYNEKLVKYIICVLGQYIREQAYKDGEGIECDEFKKHVDDVVSNVLENCQASIPGEKIKQKCCDNSQINRIIKEVESKSEKTKKKAEKLINQVGWNYPPFHKKIDSSDYHGISFQRVVADAAVYNEIRGRGLDRYYLVAANCKSEQEIFENVFYKNDEDDFNSGKEPERTKMRKNKIVMAVAAKLVEEQIKNSRWFVKADYENWCQITSGNASSLKVFRYWSGDTKVDKKTGETINIKKVLFREKNIIDSISDKVLLINNDWFDKCGWTIMTKEELSDALKENQKGAPVFYRDYYYEEDGGPFLQMNTFYKEEKEYWREQAESNATIIKLFDEAF